MKIITGIIPFLTTLFLPAYSQEVSPFNFSAGVDVYYAYDFNKPRDRDRQYVTQAARHNEFNLNLGFIRASFDNGKVRANLGLQAGTYPLFNYRDESSDLLRIIAEANAGVMLMKDVWLDAGIISGHIGYESTFSFDNELYTRSLLAENTPYYQTGVRLSAPLTDKFDLQLLVLNGWQNITETNHAKSVGLLLRYRVSDKLEVNYSNYLGNEDTLSSRKKIRFYNDLYARYAINDNWLAVVQFDYGTQEQLTTEVRGHIFAIMGLAQCTIGDRFQIGARFEHFNDSREILVRTGTPDGFINSNAGLSFDYLPVPYVKCRLEGRAFFSPDEIYNAGDTAKKNNFVLVAGISVNLNREVLRE